MGFRSKQLIISSPAATGNQVHTWGTGARHCRLANTQYFTVADNATHSAGDVDLWAAVLVYLDSKSEDQIYTGHWETTGNQRSYSIQYDTATDRFWASISNDGTAVVTEPADVLGNVSTKTWYLIFIWHDSVNNTLNIQVNGGTADSVAHTTGLHNSTGAFTVGAGGSGTLPTNGRIAMAATGKPADIDAVNAAIATFLGDGSSKPDFDAITSAQKTAWGLTAGNGSWYKLNEENATDNAVDSVNAVNLTATNDPGTAYAPGDSMAWTPKFGVVETVGHTAEASTTDAVLSFGFTDFTTARCAAIASQDAQGTSIADRRHDNGFISLLAVGGAVLEDTDTCAVASGELTINWTTVAAAANKYSILLIGGDGVEAFVGNFQPSPTGLLTITGTGLKADALVCITVGQSLDPPASDATANIGIGFSDFTNHAAIASSSTDGSGTSNTDRAQTASYGQMSITSAAIAQLIEPKSSFLDGFVVDVNTNGSDEVSYLAIKGVGANVVNDKTVPAATGLQHLGVPGAKAAIFLSIEHATKDAQQNHNVVSIGMTDGTVQASANATDETALGTTDANRAWTESDLLTIYSEVPTNLADAQIDDLHVGSINWVDVDAGAQAYYALLLGDPSGGTVLRGAGRLTDGTLRNRELGRLVKVS